MTRQEKIKKAEYLETEIRKIKDFLEILEYKMTIHPSNSFSNALIKKEIKTTFLGVWSNRKSFEIIIPDYINTEIAAKCIMWIKELEGRCDKLVVND